MCVCVCVCVCCCHCPGQAVASLLSIWTTKYNAKASHSHPEFKGRMNTLSNKAELYSSLRNNNDRCSLTLHLMLDQFSVKYFLLQHCFNDWSRYLTVCDSPRIINVQSWLYVFLLIIREKERLFIKIAVSTTTFHHKEWKMYVQVARWKRKTDY